MKGIERDMLLALQRALKSYDDRFEWHRANMRVKRTQRLFPDDPAVNVYYKDTLIAHIWQDGWTWSLAAGNTKTIRSRINALQAYLGGYQVRSFKDKPYLVGRGLSVRVNTRTPVLNSPYGTEWPGYLLKEHINGH